MNKRRWTAEEDAAMRELYPQRAIDLLTSKLNRSRQAVKHRAILLGLTGVAYGGRGRKASVGDEVLRRGITSVPIVMTDQGWRRKSHLVWESAHGPVPPGMHIVFNDGCCRNCSLENLVLTSPAEKARRMTLVRLGPPELREVSDLLKQLRKALNEHQNHR